MSLYQLHTSKILLAIAAVKTVSQDTEVRIVKKRTWSECGWDKIDDPYLSGLI